MDRLTSPHGSLRVDAVDHLSGPRRCRRRHLFPGEGTHQAEAPGVPAAPVPAAAAAVPEPAAALPAARLGQLTGRRDHIAR
ncbi:hypothetical protein DMH03_36385 [Amycolatopsis sp. WAC 01376]|nr:hypothetical protein DMH03_36385 [Amycolatopsis sp. WAC 01376]